MKTDSAHLDRLKRYKYSSPEQKFEWMYSALCFAQAEKKIVTKKKRVAKK